jgi:hypothetical protein
MKVIKIILILFLFSSCTKEMGSKIVGGNLSVYYKEKSDKDKAESVAKYWKNNNLIAECKQDLQLVRFQDGYELRLIAKNPENVNKISFNERKMLSDLQRDISDSLKLKGIQLVLCNSNFKPILNINQ